MTEEQKLQCEKDFGVPMKIVCKSGVFPQEKGGQAQAQEQGRQKGGRSFQVFHVSISSFRCNV